MIRTHRKNTTGQSGDDRRRSDCPPTFHDDVGRPRRVVLWASRSQRAAPGRPTHRTNGVDRPQAPGPALFDRVAIIMHRSTVVVVVSFGSHEQPFEDDDD